MAFDFNDPTGLSMGEPMAPLQAAVNYQGASPTTQGSTVSTAAGAAVSPVTVPGGAPAGAAGVGKTGFFQPGGGASLALGAIQTLGSLWNSFQQNKLAKKSFALQERAFETNLRNQTQTYNTALEDRINARYATEGRSGEAAGYIEKNRL